MKATVLYHSHCNDGFGAAWAAWVHLIKDHEVVIIPVSYNKPVPEFDYDSDVYIVDFSYSPEVMIQLANKVRRLTWIDHHKTALDAWEGTELAANIPENMFIRVSLNHSGAMLTWIHFSNIRPPKLIQHIQDRDLWKFELKGTKEIHLNLNTYPKDVYAWNVLMIDMEIPAMLDKFIAEGAAIQRYYDQLIDNILATNKVQVTLDGKVGLACNCPGALASDLGHKLATESGTFGLTWEEQNGMIEKISLRSNGDYDVAVMAKAWGGGGHKNAAGFVIDLNRTHPGTIRFDPI